MIIKLLNSFSYDCEGIYAAPVETPNVGICASLDILATDQACVDMVYAMTPHDRHALVERIESRHGLRQLSYMKELDMGCDKYKLIDMDNDDKIITYDILSWVEKKMNKLEAIFMCEENVKIEETVVEAAVEIEPLFEECVDFETFSKSDFRVVKVKECSAVKKSKKLLHFVLDDGTGTDRIILSGIHAFYEPEELVGKTLLAITNLPPRNMMGIDSCGMLMSAIHTVGGEEKLNLVMLDDAIPAGAKLY